MRTFSSFQGRRVVTESGRDLGKCNDLRASVGRGKPSVVAIVVGRTGWLEHLGVTHRARRRKDAVAWDTVVRVEGDRIVVRDGTELE